MSSEDASTGVLTPLRTFAVQGHELYTELVEAGFREEQAVSILVGLTRKE
jgi:hypothetical protein